MATVFLDLDGTLTDPAPGITASVNHALSALGHTPLPPAEMGWMIGPPLLDTFARLGVADPQAALGHYRARYAETGLFENRVYDGIPEALTALAQAGHRMVLMTAKPHIYARRITAHFGLARFMVAEYGPELDGTRNDKAELLAHAITELGTTGDAVMVGDRTHDIAAGKANGCATLAVAWGYGTPEEHAAADRIVRHPDRLAAAVRDLIG